MKPVLIFPFVLALVFGCTTVDKPPSSVDPLAMAPVVQIGHLGKINAVAITKDARIGASASSDGTVKIWEIRTGRLIKTLNNHLKQKKVAAWEGANARGRFLHTPSVNCIAISHDSRFIVSGASDGNAIVSNLSGGQTLRVFQKHDKSINAAAR